MGFLSNLNLLEFHLHFMIFRCNHNISFQLNPDINLNMAIHHNLWETNLTMGEGLLKLHQLISLNKLVVNKHMFHILLQQTCHIYMSYIHRWISNYHFLQHWTYPIYLTWQMIPFCIILLGQPFLINFRQIFQSLMVNLVKILTLMLWFIICGVPRTPLLMIPFDYDYSNKLSPRRQLSGMQSNHVALFRISTLWIFPF